MRPVLPLMLTFCISCTVVDAPDNLEALMVFGFEHFEDEDEVLQDFVEALLPLVDNVEEELSAGYRIDSLPGQALLDVGVSDPEVDNIIGAMGSARYRHTVPEVLDAVTMDDKDVHFDNFESYTVLEDTDRQAFLDGDSSRYEMTIEQTVRIPLLGSATQVIEQVYRRVEDPEGQPWIISRVLSPAGVDFSSSIVAIDQQYNLYVIHPLPEGARRIEAFWVEARFIGVDIPDSVAVDNFASGVDDQAARVDDYLDGL